METAARMAMTEIQQFEHGRFRVEVAARSDVGKVRQVNEDAYCVSPRLWAVSDGMGGHAAGDVAASMCVAACLDAGSSQQLSVSDLGGLITSVNSAVRRDAETHGRHGMGATLVGVALADNGDVTSLVVFNVGDSRCYELVGDSPLRQVTTDHSVVQELVDAGQLTAAEATTHPERHVITRGVGIDPHAVADLIVLPDVERRRVVLCSDGVSDELSNARIEAELREGDSASEAADAILVAALEGTARDNATVVVVDVEWEGAAPTAANPLDEVTGPSGEVDEDTTPRDVSDPEPDALLYGAGEVWGG